jgi:photosystem II stability/assembly factor-like uncharacterized protein
MANDKALTSKKNGALWIQVNGPNTKPEYLGCHDLGDLTEAEGSIELLRCIQPDGTWKTVGSTQAPPDPVTASIENLTFGVRDALERLKCEFTLFALFRSGGEANVFDTFIRANILTHARVTSRTDSGIVHHEEDQPSMQSRDIEGWPPILRTGAIELIRQTTSETLDLNDVHTFSPLDCENGIVPGDKAVAAADASIYTGNIQITFNAGDDWDPTAADPFAVGKSAMAVRAFPLTETITRILAVKVAEPGAQGLAKYSDDNGATWTSVNIGGAASGHGAKNGGALCVINQSNIWLASVDGYIWFSEDGGASWTAQTSGDVTTEDALCVNFKKDGVNGMAGFENDVILYTTDGGENWNETTEDTASAGHIMTVAPAGDYWWAGTDDGKSFYTRNLYGIPGTTWTERSFTGSGTGTVPSIAFANELIGYMVKNSAAPIGTVLVTINGGYSWKPLQTPQNAGLNAVSIADDSTIYVVGNTEGGTAVILKGEWN